MHESERTRNSAPSRLAGTYPVCAYLHRAGDYERSKVMSLVNLVPLVRSLRRPRTDPRAILEAVMHKRLILLLGVFLGSRVLTAAQMPAPELVPPQELVASIVTAAPAPLLAVSLLLPEYPGKSAAHRQCSGRGLSVGFRRC